MVKGRAVKSSKNVRKRQRKQKARHFRLSQKRQSKIDEAATFITNISEYPLSNDQILALSKGLGFIPTPGKPSRTSIMRDCNNLIRTMRIRYIAAHNIWPKRHKFRLPSEWDPDDTMSLDLEDFFESMKVELSTIPYSKVKVNYTPNEMKAWEKLKNDKNIILKPYDKGRGIAIISRKHYIEEGYRQLSNKDQYMKLDYNPTASTAEMLHNLSCKMLKDEQIDKSLADYLDPYNGQMRTPVFFILPKTHKTPPEGVRFVGRPVVSSCSSPLERASELIDFYLLPSVKTQPSYLKDTGETIRKIESLHLPFDIILASFDIVSMFTSVPQDEAFRITLEILSNLNSLDYDPPLPDMKYMSELLRLVLYRNSFEFNGDNFLQISGVPMGQRSSGSICNLVVHELEKIILSSTKHIHKLYRYMDDTLVFWTGSFEELEAFVKHINTLHETLKFTYEASEHSIQFLDLVIYKGDRFKTTNILDIKCHTKKTETGQFLHRSSCHPQSVFDGFLRGEILRYARNNNNLNTFEEKKSFFKEKLSKRGYSESEFRKAENSVRFEDRSNFIEERYKSSEIPLVFKTQYNPYFKSTHIKTAINKHWEIINGNASLKRIFPKPPMIAYSRAKNLRDTLVSAKLPARESGDIKYEDFDNNEPDSSVSPTLKALQDLEKESRGFNIEVHVEDETQSSNNDDTKPSPASITYTDGNTSLL